MDRWGSLFTAYSRCRASPMWRERSLRSSCRTMCSLRPRRCLATGRQPGTFAENSYGKSGPSAWAWGVPKNRALNKGLIRNISMFSPFFSEQIRVLKLRYSAFLGGPGGFREVREAGRNHFHLSWYLIVPGPLSIIVCFRFFLLVFLIPGRHFFQYCIV